MRASYTSIAGSGLSSMELSSKYAGRGKNSMLTRELALLATRWVKEGLLLMPDRFTAD